VQNDARANNRDMEYLKTSSETEVSSSILKGGLLTASRFTRLTPGQGLTSDHVQEDAFMLAFQAKPYQGKIWVDGNELDFRGSQEGSFTFYDYSRVWKADLQSAFDCVNFYISRSALTSLEDEFGTKRIDEFAIAPGANIDDPVIKGIVGAIMPIIEGHHATNQLMLDYVGTALLVHMISTYGQIGAKSGYARGGLTAKQLSEAKQLIDANLHGKLTLADISSQSGLSSAYFARAFKASTGSTPHRWLSDRRIQAAVEKLKDPNLSLSKIAHDCGYADQAHFTRSFAEAKGMPPSVWRRERQKIYGNLSM
jgi:AraC family transcriptional regulator